MTDNEVQKCLQEIQYSFLNIRSGMVTLKKIVAQSMEIASKQKNVDVFRELVEMSKAGEAIWSELEYIVREMTKAGVIIDIEEIVGEKWTQ